MQNNQENVLKNKKMMRGVVVSDKMDKTITVKYNFVFVSKKIGKIIRKDKKYKVHDEKSIAKIGEIVEFYQVRKLSKTKYMMLNRVIV